MIFLKSWYYKFQSYIYGGLIWDWKFQKTNGGFWKWGWPKNLWYEACISFFQVSLSSCRIYGMFHSSATQVCVIYACMQAGSVTLLKLLEGMLCQPLHLWLWDCFTEVILNMKKLMQQLHHHCHQECFYNQYRYNLS